MVWILQKTSVKIAVAAGSAVALFAGGMAWAGVEDHLPTRLSGTGQVKTKIVTEVDPFTLEQLNTWVNLPSARVEVNVPAGGARLITARFNAETRCNASDTIGFGWCSARIVARKTGSTSTIEMHPRAGSDFAIDSLGKLWDGNSINRSLRLGSGTWNVWVQGRVVGDQGTLGVDDFHFEVQVSQAS